MSGAAPRLDQLRRDHPGWAPSLGLYERALAETENRWWEAALVEVRPEDEGRRCLLDGASVAIDAGEARDWTGRLAAAGGEEAGGRACAERADPVEVIAAAVRQDHALLEALATRAGVLGETLAAFAHLAALPLLAAAGRLLAARVPAGWPNGWCPVCGAWPALSEFRGLDQSRRLRCGRCAADWESLWLRCPFCATTDHNHLVALVPEVDTDRRKVDTCAACKGYLKATPTLRSLSLAEIVAADLGSVDLDLVALERGFARPEATPIEVRVDGGGRRGVTGARRPADA
jgi:FdhE protein